LKTQQIANLGLAKIAVQCSAYTFSHSFIIFNRFRETFQVVVNQSLVLPARSGLPNRKNLGLKEL
jgi:hypothetical protein